MVTALYVEKPCHSPEASVAADFISQKVGVSIDAQESHILCAMLYTGYSTDSSKSLTSIRLSAKKGFVNYFQDLDYLATTALAL